ncbi:helicase HerA-like C-terminal domain-containing protein [Pararhizobium haloflavum]|uniref:helicase HerA-like C-terminal domain-containing protein n=1 Tax=Pararhizobium haloflavum TaxID=2037914 RepID=UPI000C178118|nr:helicase HerA-like C-terminal domain-containing protein [Pararhizobium haloflavum]
MQQQGKLYIGTSRTPDDAAKKGEYLTLKYANRHGLVTGATGTGKTVTLQILAQGFSDAGVPVFCADVKGDLAGIAAVGEPKDFLEERASFIGLSPYAFKAAPTVFWDLFGEKGHRIRTTMTEMGPLLLSRLMDASDAQEGVLNIAFKLADEHGLPILDLKDLRSLLTYMAEHADELSSLYGNISPQSVGALQRGLLVLEQQGAEHFFGEPALRITDLMRTTHDGRGLVNVLAADRLMMNPRLYATFLLWLLSELFEELPEVGDPDKPRLVFFFDEAHLLFDEAPQILLERVEQVVRLIRSKGVGVYFVTQNPLDVPDSVLAQLGNRIQHALRAYTPREQKAVKVAAETFRPNPEFDCYEAITQLGVGEALVSTLEDKGVPSMVERTLIRPPASRMGPISDAERTALMAASPVAGQYDRDVDPESAHEILSKRAADAAAAEEERRRKEAEAEEEVAESRRWTLPGFGDDEPDDYDGRGRKTSSRRAAPRRSGYQRQTVTETVVKTVARTAANQIGRALVRGILGSLKKGL